jgi:hypothetical protein
VKKKKEVVRVVRISKELDGVLRNDADAKGTTVSAVISSALTRYAEWDRLADRAGFVTFAGSFLRDIVQYVPDEELRKIVQNMGDFLRGLTLFWFKKANFETFLSTVKLMNKYARAAECEIHVEGGNYTMSFHHEFGRKLSIVIWTLLEQAMIELRIKPTCEIGDNYLNVSFAPIAGAFRAPDAPV